MGLYRFGNQVVVLQMPSEDIWQNWLERLYNLRRDKRSCPTSRSPLLAILDLLDKRRVTRNDIPLNEDLVKTFRRYFGVVRQRDDKPSIENPFYLVSGGGFWTLRSSGRNRLDEPGNATKAMAKPKTLWRMPAEEKAKG